MNKRQVEVGGTYWAKVSGRWVHVEIVAPHPNGGWEAFNLDTRRPVRIKTAARLWRMTMTEVRIHKELQRRLFIQNEEATSA